jgi:hypothetical protein
MLEMLADVVIGLVFLVVGVLLIFIGMPKHGEQPRFTRFDAAIRFYIRLSSLLSGHSV